MKCRTKKIIFILSLLLMLAKVPSAFAETYTQDIGVSFTFNSALSVTLSSNNLVISNLAPGTASDSNVIDINVITNSVNGYTLNASVGNNSSYNTRDLIHNNSGVSNKFTSLDYGSSVASINSFGDDKWGYSVSTNNGSTWAAYSGLPSYSDSTHVATIKNAAGPVSSDSGDNIKFKIAAKAASTQASGEYNNVINFELTAAPVPTTLSMAFENAGKTKLNGYYKMQDMTSAICSATDISDGSSQLQLIDARDNKVYWVSKLADGKCWMTQNLDLDIDENTTYTHADTDLGWGTNFDATATWMPDRSTYATNVSTWVKDSTKYYIQQSYDPGDIIWNEITTDGIVTFNDIDGGDNYHYHIGNYYNWNAAVAMNDTSGVTGINDINQSICPSGWKLPTTADQDYFIRENNLGSNADIWDEPFYYVPTGRYDGTTYTHLATDGEYWSSTSYGNTEAYVMSGYIDFFDSEIKESREYGYPIRCIVR